MTKLAISALELAQQLLDAVCDADVFIPGDTARPNLDELREQLASGLASLKQQPQHLADGEVWARLHAAAKQAGSAAALAREIGITKQALGDVLTGKKEPGPSILKHMGLRKVVRGDVYVAVDVETPTPPRPISERHQRARDLLPRLPKSAPVADAGVSP